MRIRISKMAVCLTAFLMVLFVFAAVAAAQGCTVNGTLWIDSDTDGVFDKGENGLRNSTLILERLSPAGEVTSAAVRIQRSVGYVIRLQIGLGGKVELCLA